MRLVTCCCLLLFIDNIVVYCLVWVLGFGENSPKLLGKTKLAICINDIWKKTTCYNSLSSVASWCSIKLVSGYEKHNNLEWNCLRWGGTTESLMFGTVVVVKIKIILRLLKIQTQHSREWASWVAWYNRILNSESNCSCGNETYRFGLSCEFRHNDCSLI